MLFLCDTERPWPSPWPTGLQVWRAHEGDVRGWRQLWPGPVAACPVAPPGALWEPLRPGTEILGPDGAPAEGQTPFLYTVETDVIPGAAEDFHAWYEQEHLPGLARVPGCVRARRLVRQDGPSGLPRHVACYELMAAEVTHSAPWLAVRHTDWSGRVRPTFCNTHRTMWARQAPSP